MTLFAGLLFPLSFLFITKTWFPAYAEGRSGFVPFLRGALVFIPAYLIFWIIDYFLSFQFTFWSQYGYFLIHDYAIYILLALIGYLIIYGIPKKYKIKPSFKQFFAFFTGFFMAVTWVELLLRFGNYNNYILFFLPLSRVACVVLFLLLLFKGWYSQDPYERAVFFLMILPLFFFVGFVPALFMTFRYIIAWVVLGLLCAISIGFLVYIVKEL